MGKYEIMYILTATLDDEARKAEISKLQGILDANKVSVIDTKEWGLRDFAYPIKKQLKGYIFGPWTLTVPGVPRDKYMASLPVCEAAFKRFGH